MFHFEIGEKLGFKSSTNCYQYRGNCIYFHIYLCYVYTQSYIGSLVQLREARYTEEATRFDSHTSPPTLYPCAKIHHFRRTCGRNPPSSSLKAQRRDKKINKPEVIGQRTKISITDHRLST